MDNVYVEVLPIQTPILKAGDTLSDVLRLYAEFASGDIVCVSSKAVATVEGAAFLCDDFTKAVEKETERMNGKIIQSPTGVLLTELKPEGMEGTFLVPNAGLDRSNVKEEYVIGWPVDPVKSVKELRKNLEVAVILTDSGLSPRRRGVTAFAIACCGIDPIISKVGQKDLFGREIHMTEEAIADQLATAANMVMGNCNESTPAAIIRNSGIPLSNYCGWVGGIEREKDLYHGII